MDLNLQAVSATVVLGAYFSIGLVALFRIFFGVPRTLPQVSWPGAETGTGERLSGVLTTALLLALLFGIGILAEDMSSQSVDLPETLWSDLNILAPESKLRVDALFGDLESGEIRPLGRKWAEAGLLDLYGGSHGPAVGEAARRGRVYELAQRTEAVKSVASETYYHAKNRLYRERNYFEELRAIQQRIDFTRSLSLLTLILFLCAILFGGVEYIWPNLAATVFVGWKEQIAGRGRTSDWSVAPASVRRRQVLLRAVAAFLPLVLIFLCARMAYAHEEQEFNLRTYGYFMTLETEGGTRPLDLSLPDISGLARIGDREILVVHDTKRNRDDPTDVSGPRVGVLEHSCDRTAPAFEYRSVDVHWEGFAASNDLEGACAVPGRPREVFAVESKPASGVPARLFHLRVTQASGRWIGIVERAFVLPEDEEDLADVEGVACVPRPGGETLVVLCDRTSGALWSATVSSDPRSPALLDLSRIGTSAAPTIGWLSDGDVRVCSDLYAAPDGTLWASATQDPDVNTGPFRSLVYRTGTIVGDRFAPTPPNDARRLAARFDGFKVEAVGPGIAPSHDLVVGTDDEDYGGTWRPVTVTRLAESEASSGAGAQLPQR